MITETVRISKDITIKARYPEPHEVTEEMMKRQVQALKVAIEWALAQKARREAKQHEQERLPYTS